MKSLESRLFAPLVIGAFVFAFCYSAWPDLTATVGGVGLWVFGALMLWVHQRTKRD